MRQLRRQDSVPLEPVEQRADFSSPSCLWRTWLPIGYRLLPRSKQDVKTACSLLESLAVENSRFPSKVRHVRLGVRSKCRAIRSIRHVLDPQIRQPRDPVVLGANDHGKTNVLRLCFT